MFCKKCGSQLSENAAFCSNCGEPVTASTEANVNPYTSYSAQSAPEQPVQQPEGQSGADTVPGTGSQLYTQQNSHQSAYPEQAQAVDRFAQPEFDEPKKKAKKSFKTLIVAAAVVLVAAILVAFNASALQGFAIKTFGSTDDYFKYVEDKALDSYASGISKSYGSLLSYNDVTGASKAQLKLKVGEDALELLETYIAQSAGEEIDLDWLNTVTVDVDSNFKDNVSQIGTALSIDSQVLADIDVIVDMNEMDVFVGILNLSDKYLKTSADTDDVDASANDAMTEFMEMLPELKKELPSEKELDKLIDKYLGIVMDNLNEVTKSTEVVEVGDVSEKLTVLEFELDSDTLLEISIAVLEEAKNDKQLKKYITNVAEYLEKEDIIDDAADVYDDFVDAIEDELDIIEDIDDDNEKILTIVDYINSDHEIVGRDIETPYGDILSYITVRDGKNFASEFEIPNTLRIEGSGTDKGGRINAEFTLESSGQEILDITVKDFDNKKAAQGYLNGSVVIAPTTYTLKQMGLDDMNASVLAIADPAIEFVFSSEKNSSTVEINLLNDDELFVGITISGEQTKASKIEIPAGSDVIDSEDAAEWEESVDFDSFISALRDTTLPEELVDAIEQSIYGGLDG